MNKAIPLGSPVKKNEGRSNRETESSACAPNGQTESEETTQPQVKERYLRDVHETRYRRPFYQPVRSDENTLKTVTNPEEPE